MSATCQTLKFENVNLHKTTSFKVGFTMTSKKKQLNMHSSLLRLAGRENRVGAIRNTNIIDEGPILKASLGSPYPASFVARSRHPHRDLLDHSRAVELRADQSGDVLQDVQEQPAR